MLPGRMKGSRQGKEQRRYKIRRKTGREIIALLEGAAQEVGVSA
jgi:hypothetical protein